MVLSRGLRDEVKTAFWGRAVDRQVVGLAWGLAHHPTPACLHQLSPNSRSVVRTCSTLDKQTAVTEGQKEENPDLCFILASTPFHETPRFGQMGMAQSTLAMAANPIPNSDPQPSNHQWLFHCVTSRWSLRMGSRGVLPDLGAKLARHS